MIDPTSSKTTGFHLFIEPAGELASTLNAIITTLATEYGGPVFAPHITVLARIPAGDKRDLITKSEALARALTPLTLTLSSVGTQNTFYKALYIQIKEASALTRYHTLANEIFGMKDEGEYMPHLSLLYGNYDAAQKQETMANLVVPTGASFVADKLHLYSTEGEVGRWKKIREFKLRG